MTTMDDELRRMLEHLKMPGLIERWEDLIGAGASEDMSHAAFLRHVAMVLFEATQARARDRRLANARIPEKLVMQTYPFAKQPKLNKKRITNLHDSLEYMTKSQNIVLIGPTAVGKSGLGTAFLIQALNHGYRGCFITFPELIDKLFQSVAAHREDRVLKYFAAFNPLLIDEVGYVDVEPAQVGLFFRLMSMRHRVRSTIVTSNLGFQDWGSFLKNQQLTAALLSRLTENSHVFNMRNCVAIRPPPAYVDKTTETSLADAGETTLQQQPEL
jgi:DNA replication protein DnaC